MPGARGLPVVESWPKSEGKGGNPPKGSGLFSSGQCDNGGTVTPLDPRIIDVRRITGLIFSACMSVGAFVVLATLGWSTRPGWRVMVIVAGAWLVGTVALALWMWRWPDIFYRHASYRLDEEGLEIRRGVVWRSIINVPRSRVQHTDVSQGPLERSHGLSTLIVHTAGTEHARVGLAGLSREDALSLRDQLLPRDGRDAV